MLLRIMPLLLFVLAPCLPTRGFALDQEKMIDRRFDVEEGETLEIDVGDSDVEVVTGSSNEVLVEIFLDGRGEDRAREYFERQNFRVSYSGNTIRVESDPEDRHLDWRFWRNHPQILTRVTVPERFNADLRTSDGDVRLERLRGEVYLKTSDGDVVAGVLEGERIRLATSDGDIRAESLSAETVEIQTSDGDLLLDAVRATRVQARTSDGDIRTGRLSGEVDLKTSDGDIQVDGVEGERFVARTSDGDISVDEILAGSSYVRTSDGNITLRGVSGRLEVQGSDSEIYVELAKPGDVDVTSSEGDIVIVLEADAPADVYLHGEDVRLSSSFEFKGRIDDERAEGSVNGGGRRIEARTSDGTVTLRAK